MIPYSQSNIAWRFISFPIRYFLKGKCQIKRDEIRRANSEIELCIIGGRRLGKTTTNMIVLLHSRHIKQKAEKFLMWWS